jgi:hypothetical protein
LKLSARVAKIFFLRVRHRKRRGKSSADGPPYRAEQQRLTLKEVVESRANAGWGWTALAIEVTPVRALSAADVAVSAIDRPDATCSLKRPPGLTGRWPLRLTRSLAAPVRQRTTNQVPCL